jgi:peptidoglycan/LPS O-acetylase OafA/YrhL
MNVETHKAPYFVHIDGLRALAVLAVMAYHLNPVWLPGGFSGVDIFFVISGFVVSASVVKLNVSAFSQFLLVFYSRRVQRIVPALMVCLVVTCLLSALFIPQAWLSEKSRITGLAAFLGFSNFVLAQTGNDYFSPTAEFNPFTHTWSLGVEEQFYLIFPMLFFSWIASDRGRKRSALLFAMAALASIAAAFWLGRQHSPYAFYMIVSRFWELAAGVLLYQYIASSGSSRSFKSPAALVSGVMASAALIVIGFLFSSPVEFPFPGAIPAVAGTLGLLYFLHEVPANNWIARPLTNRTAVFIGKISYSLYLWHWPVFVLFKWTVGTESALLRIAALGIAFVLAIASYYLIETRIRHSAYLHQTSRGARLAAGLVLIAVCFSVSAIVAKTQNRISLSTVSRNADDWDTHVSRATGSFGACEVGKGTERLQGGMIYVLSRTNCPQAAPVKNRLYVIGDSHAGQFDLMLRKYALQTGKQVLVYSAAGCAVIGLRAPMAEDEKCKSGTTVALNDVLGRINSGDTIFLASLRLQRFGDQWAKFDETPESTSSPRAVAERKAAEHEAVNILSQFSAKGARIIFSGPTPVFRAPAFRCSDWFNKMNPICAHGLEVKKSEIERYREPVLQSIANISREVQGVRLWDPFPTLCPGDVCSASRDGLPLFFDGDHLSAYSNTLLFTEFVRFVGDAG